MIVRRTPWKTLSQLPMEDANALCTSMNQALQAWFEKANATHTAVQKSVQLHGPARFQAFVEKGSTVLDMTNAPAWAGDALGATLQLEGDARWNRLNGTGALLHPYAGEDGNVNATLYHDCAALDAATAGVCGHVKIIRSTSEVVLPERDIPLWWLWEGSSHRTGNPDRFQLEPLNPGAGSQPAMVLRVWPMPTADVTLAFSVARHFTLTTADLQAGRVLPVPEDVAGGILFPIALDRAAGQALLVKDTDLKRVAADAAAAIGRIGPRTMIPTAETQWMGTAYGY